MHFRVTDVTLSQLAKCTGLYDLPGSFEVRPKNGDDEMVWRNAGGPEAPWVMAALFESWGLPMGEHVRVHAIDKKASALLHEALEQLEDEGLQTPMVAGFYAAARSGQSGAA